MRRVLLIAYNYPPDGAAGSARPARFTRYLPRYGYSPEVLTATGAGDGVRIVPDNPPAWAKRLWRFLPEMAFTWSGRAVGEALKMIHGRSGDSPIQVMISTAPPFAVHWAALGIKQKDPRIKWIADFRDPLVGSPARTRRAQRLLDPHLEEMIFRHADALIANTDAVAELWRERYPQWRSKIHVIWNGFDPGEAFGPAPIPPRPHRLLLHVGELYGVRQPAPVTQALERVGADAGLRARFVGASPEDTGEPEQYRRAVSEGLAEFLPPVSKAEARAAMAEADYLLLLDFHRDGAPALQLPSKIFDYVRIGRPILGVTKRGSPVERVLERCGIPSVVMYYGDDPEINARKLQDLLALPPVTTPMSEWFCRTFNGEEQTATLAQILDRCLEAR